MANAYQNQGKFEAAQEALEAGLKLLNGQPCLEAGRLYIWKGLILFRQGRPAEALAACEQGVALVEGAGGALDLAQAHNLEGIIRRNMGHPDHALGAHERSIALYRQVQYLPGLEKAYSNLACVYQDLGRWTEALQYFQKSADLSDRTGEERRRAAAPINLGEVYYLRGELHRALEACEQARRLVELFGFVDYAGIVALNLGKAYLKGDQLAQARRYLDESLAICQRLRNDVHVPEILRHQATLGVKEGRLDDALRLAHEAMGLAANLGPREVGLTHRSLGEAYRALRRWAEAEAHLRESLSVLQEQNNRYEVGLTLLELARLRWDQVRLDHGYDALRTQGIGYCDQAIAIFAELGASLDLKLAQETRRSLGGVPE
jgi:tetratricopeptide (TPR) repeat protein